MSIRPLYTAVVLAGVACGCMPAMPKVPEQSPDRFSFTAVLHSPGTLAGVPADHWYAEPLPEDRKLGRKPRALDVSAVPDQAKALDGKRVKVFMKMPDTRQEAEAMQHVAAVRSIEPAE
jgi:hypothetical protein